MTMTLGRGISVVIGAAALVSGALMMASPASAQLHRSNVGAGIAAGPDGAASCNWQRQRVWDGYSWRVQRLRVCD